MASSMSSNKEGPQQDLAVQHEPQQQVAAGCSLDVETPNPVFGAAVEGDAERAPRLDDAAPAYDLSRLSNLSIHSDVHYSHRSPWLRAFVLGALDGLVSVASIMAGIGGGTDDLTVMRLAGLAGWVAGALSMGVGEYVSVASQKDTEEADIAKERAMQEKGPEARAYELQELTNIYINRGLSPLLARQVAEELTAVDVIRAHARDELGIDMDELANPTQAALVSMMAFTLGAAIPLLAGSFIEDWKMRLVSICVTTTVGLLIFGISASIMGGSKITMGAVRVLLGGWAAMGITAAIGYAFGVTVG